MPAVIALWAGAALAALAPSDAGVPLASLPQGGTAHDVNGRQVELVRHGDTVRGFLRLSPRGYGMVTWCPDDQVLLVPSYGETFDGQGRLMRDYSPRDLDTVQVTVRGDHVFVAPDRVTRGRSRIVDGRIVRDRQAIADWRAAHRGRDLPVDFCNAGTGTGLQGTTRAR